MQTGGFGMSLFLLDEREEVFFFFSALLSFSESVRLLTRDCLVLRFSVIRCVLLCVYMRITPWGCFVV